MIKNVIFDLDGTLADTIEDIKNVGDVALSRFGLSGIPTEKYKSFVGDGAKTLCDRMLAYNRSTESAEELLTEYLKAYAIHEGEKIRPFPGIKEVLSDLTQSGVKLFVISNKPVKNVKTALGILYPTIDFVELIGGDSGFPLKPDATSYAYLRDKYGLKEAETVYVGDGDADVRFAQNIGVFGISCLWGYRTKEDLEKVGAVTFATTSADLIGIIRSL